MRIRNKPLCPLAVCLGGLSPGAFAQYEPPAGYYNTATGVGPALRSQLRAIMGKDFWDPASTSHRVRTYANATLALHIMARDPANAANVILIYSGVSVPGIWDSGVTWNREHTWPDSRGLAGSGPDYTDLHQLRPCNPSVNSSRGNDAFGIGGGSYWDPQPSTNSFFSGSGSGAFVPGTNDRGEMARAMFYMDVRYDGTDASTTDLTLVNGFPSGNQMGDLAQLVQWHFSDAVNQTERQRNHLVFSNADNPNYFQGNRNPFVDHPEYVWALWGTSPNDSTLFVGGAPAPDGSSSAAVTFRVIQGAAATAQAISITKNGATPTTFDVSVSGPGFSVSGAGTRQAFVPGTQGSMLTIGPASVATVGITIAQITIDNTDLTSAGAGDGSADANDAISLTSAVLTPSDPSFDPGTDIDSGAAFSQFDTSSGVQTIDIPVFNFGFSSTQALLDVDGETGGAARFAVVSGVVTGIAAAPGVVTFSFDTAGAAAGVYTAGFILDTSDENIPGETVDAIGLSWEVTVNNPPPPPCDGDANGDLVVNFGDITSALEHWGGGAGPGDANHDGIVNFSDITSVLNNWGATCL